MDYYEEQMRKCNAFNMVPKKKREKEVKRRRWWRTHTQMYVDWLTEVHTIKYAINTPGYTLVTTYWSHVLEDRELCKRFNPPPLPRRWSSCHPPRFSKWLWWQRLQRTQLVCQPTSSDSRTTPLKCPVSSRYLLTPTGAAITGSKTPASNICKQDNFTARDTRARVESDQARVGHNWRAQAFHSTPRVTLPDPTTAREQAHWLVLMFPFSRTKLL